MAAKKPTTTTAPELRPLEEILEQIREVFGHLEGVQGFSITGRTGNASLNMKWGDLKIRRRGLPSPTTEKRADRG